MSDNIKKVNLNNSSLPIREFKMDGWIDEKKISKVKFKQKKKFTPRNFPIIVMDGILARKKIWVKDPDIAEVLM